ncbi:ribonuclease Z [Alkalihalobacillus hwajinpoensis]|uniref:ribonuclease Z n=1 Tax=Guptibacillus hwajinpoensis TaxID=208199 RepID=UPI00188471ED|nr:ribonuclease Z [Pseudalkalibacillus hwajinpoensis]MBF0709173.1 ribonuclease Z [Pseudalkalibacillus hwajinpoensis]
MEITFLGTGAGVPSTKRNVSSAALRLDSGEVWLFDCGEATQHQILTSSISLSKMTKIFITHLHGDHIFGLPGILGSRSFQGGESELVVYGPKGLADFIDTAIRISGTYLRYPLRIVEVEDGVQVNESHFSIKVALLEHGIDSFGYRIEERDKAGTLNVEKLKALGVQPGPIYQKLKSGSSIKLENGQTIHACDVTGPTIKGRHIVVCGDTRFTEKTIDFARNADVLIHEATFSEANTRLAYEYYHSTTVQAARIAKDARVEKLLLNHISSRYQESDVVGLVEEARNVFENTDLMEDQTTVHIPLRKASST